MILSATLRLRDSFTNVMQRIRRSTDDQTESMRRNQRNTSGVQRSLTSLNAQLRAHQSELRESMHRLDGNANSLQGLRTRSESYTRQLNVHNQRVQILTRRYREMVAAHGEESTQATRAAAALARARAQQASMERQVRDTTQQIREQSTAWGRLRRDFDEARGGDGPVNRFEAMRGAGTALTGMGMVGAFGLGSALQSSSELIMEQGKLQASLGLTTQQAEKLGNMARNVWKQGFGESVGEVTQALLRVRKNMNIVDSELVKATSSAMTIAQVFDQDVNEVTAAAGVMMKNFGISGQQAMDLITVGFQRGGDFSGELLDTLREYSPQFKSLGLSADQAMAMMIAGTQAGAWNLDKVGDAMKEFNLRAQDGSKTTAEGFAMIGLDAGDMGKAIAQGGETAQKAFQVTLAALASMEDPLEQNLAGVALFGTQWEDVRSHVVIAMADGMKGIKDYQGATDAATKAIQENNPGLAMIQAMRSMREAIAPAVKPIADMLNNTVVPALKSVAEWFGNLSPGMQKAIGIAAMLATGFALLGGPMLLLIGFLPMIANGLGMVGGAFKLLGAAALNPITLALAALVVAGVLLYKNWDTIKERANKLKSNIIELKNSAVDYLKDAIEKVKDKYEEWQPVIKRTATILGVIFGPALIKTGIHAATAGAKIAATFILNVARAGTQALVSATLITANFVASLIKSGAQAVVAGGKIVISFVGSLIKTAAQATITAAIITGQLLMATLRYAASGWAVVASVTAQTTAWLIQKGAMVAGAAVTGAMTVAQWALNAAMMAAPYMWIIAAIAGVVAAGVMLYKNWDTVKAKASAIWGSIKQTLADFVSSAIEKFNEFRDRIENIWNDVKSLLKSPIKGTVNLIQKAISGGSDNAKSHAAGLAYVPYDNYPALLHKGEAVLTRVEADQYRKRQTSPKETIQYQRLIQPDSWEMPALLNNYPTLLDRGENTLPRREADHYREGQSGGRAVSISKLADTIIVREEADIKKIATALVKEIEKAEVAYGGVW